MLDSTLKKVKRGIEAGAITHRDLMDVTNLRPRTVLDALRSLIELGVVERVKLDKPRKTHEKGWTRFEYRLIGRDANSHIVEIYRE